MGRTRRPSRARTQPDPDEQAPNLRNRIVRQDSIDPKTLQANPRNWRTHSTQQKEVMRAMLRRIGFVGAVMVNERSGLLIDGHLRVEIAAEDSTPLIPVDFVNLSPEEEATVLAAYDPIGALAGVDAEMQAAVLLAAGSEDDDLQAMLDAMLSESEAVAAAFDSDPGSPPRDPRQDLGKTASNVKMVVAGVDLPTVERALASAGTPHRGRALTLICQAYLIAIGLEADPPQLRGLPDGD